MGLKSCFPVRLTKWVHSRLRERTRWKETEEDTEADLSCNYPSVQILPWVSKLLEGYIINLISPSDTSPSVSCTRNTVALGRGDWSVVLMTLTSSEGQKDLASAG